MTTEAFHGRPPRQPLPFCLGRLPSAVALNKETVEIASLPPPPPNPSWAEDHLSWAQTDG